MEKWQGPFFYWHLQCSAIILWSILSHILTIAILKFNPEGEGSSVLWVWTLICVFLRPLQCCMQYHAKLTHWGRVTHICISKLTIIGSDDGLSPDRRQAITWANVGILLIGPLETNFSEILIEILTFSFKRMRLKMSSVKRSPFCLGLNVLNCAIMAPNCV